jgi:hypothetical protein
VEAVNALLVLDEVLHAAQTGSHAANGLTDCNVHLHNLAGAVAVRVVLAIWRVCEALENVDMFARTSLTERSLMAHAK